MTHHLIIKDKAGKELATVPVQAGWTFSVVPIPKDAKKSDGPVTDVNAGDQGKGSSKVG